MRTVVDVDTINTWVKYDLLVNFVAIEFIIQDHALHVNNISCWTDNVRKEEYVGNNNSY